MVLPGSAVPLKVGVLSLVTLPVPPGRPGDGGAAEATVSTVRVSGSEGGLVLPAGSVTVAVMLELPSSSGSVSVMLQTPSVPAVLGPAASTSTERDRVRTVTSVL